MMKKKQHVNFTLNLDSKDTKQDKEDDDSGKLSGDDFDTEKYMTGKSDKDTDDKPKVQSNGYVGDKDKTLEQGNPNDSEEYNRDLEPDDDGFNENKKDPNPTPPPPLKLDGIVKIQSFKRYLKALERMVNSKKISTRTAKWSHFSDIEGGW